MNIIERLGYVKRAEHEEVIRHKDDMHRELGERHDRIQALEHGLRCARAEADRQLHLSNGARLSGARRPAVCQQCQRTFGHSSYVASEPEANGGLVEFCSPACRHDWLIARAKNARPVVAEPEDWLQAGPGAKCLWCDKPKPQICEWAMDPRGKNRIRRFFCDSQCRKAFVLASTVRSGLPGAIDLSPGKIRQSPQQKARQCRQCQKPIPFEEVTIWAHANETTATGIVSGQSVQFPFCSPGCLKRYRSGEPRMNDMTVDFAPKEPASFSAKKLWAETLAALKKHGEEMDAMAAMWGAAGVDTGGGRRSAPEDSSVYDVDGFKIRVRHAPVTDDERRVAGAEIRASIANIERNRFKALNEKLRALAAEDGRRIEELRCQAGDLGDRLEEVEHERDRALAQRDEQIKLKLEYLGQVDLYRNLAHQNAAERDRAQNMFAEVKRSHAQLEAKCDEQEAEIKLLNGMVADRETVIRRLGPLLTDKEAEQVCALLMCNGDHAVRHIMGVDQAIRTVTSRRQ